MVRSIGRRQFVLISVLTLLLFTFSATAGGETRAPDQLLALVNGTVIDGTGAAPIIHGTVIVKGNRIESVGPASGVKVPVGAMIIDAGGGTILPGLINSHVHHSAPVEERRNFLEEGVTSVCDLGTPLREMPLFAEKESSRGPAARAFFAGPIVTAPGGYPDGSGRSHGYNYEVNSPDSARKAVQALVNRGVSVIKIALDPSWNRENPLPVLDAATARAIVEEAHTHGLLVRAHLIQITSFPWALAAGVNVIEHMPFPTGWPSDTEKERYFAMEDPLAPFFNEKFPEYQTILSGIVERGMVMVPTLSALLGNLYGKKNLSIHERYVVMAIMDIIRRFRALGGVIALGNDFNGRSGKERLPLTEMRALLDAGLTSMEVIEAGTRHAATVCGADDLGTLESGKLADIIIVDGNPLLDLEALTRVRTVIFDGGIAFESSGSGVSGGKIND